MTNEEFLGIYDTAIKAKFPSAILVKAGNQFGLSYQITKQVDDLPQLIGSCGLSFIFLLLGLITQFLPTLKPYFIFLNLS